MKGHTEIIELRKRGIKPNIVFLNDYPCKDTDWFENNDHATVCTHGDPLSSLDLRYLVGMRVSITALTEARAKALYRLAIEAGADTVAAGHTQAGVAPHKQSGWSQVYHKELKNG